MARKQRKPVNTNNQVKALKPESKKYAVKVKDQTGLYLRVTPKGFKSYAVAALDPNGDQIWATLGGADVLSVDKAREISREVIPRIKAGDPPFPPPPVKPDSFRAVAEMYLRRYVRKEGKGGKVLKDETPLRSANDIQRILDKYILPTWKDRDFLSIKRSDVTNLLDHVEENHGGRTADYVLSLVRQIMRWHGSRHDDYHVVVDGRMRRTNPKERRRKRKLDDDEIRRLWAAADKAGTYGDLARFALLTGQRLRTIANAKWADIDVGGTWAIPQEERQKGNGETLPLSDMAIDIVRRQGRVNNYIFAGRKAGFNGFGRGKARLDAAIAEVNDSEPIPDWVFHDLRRTARSLLARAGVQQEIAERVLGHAQDAMVETYDRHDYEKERGIALQKLAAQIELILHPTTDNVRHISEGAR